VYIIVYMAGKPPINDPNDIDAIQAKIDAYFSAADDNHPVGFAGLAYALGYASRQSVYEVATSERPISLPVKRALLYIEADYERTLRGGQPTGSIFALKNRGWRDKQEIEHTGGIVLQIDSDDAKV
jgi:hypothetical protein